MGQVYFLKHSAEASRSHKPIGLVIFWVSRSGCCCQSFLSMWRWKWSRTSSLLPKASSTRSTSRCTRMSGKPSSCRFGPDGVLMPCDLGEIPRTSILLTLSLLRYPHLFVFRCTCTYFILWYPCEIYDTLMDHERKLELFSDVWRFVFSKESWVLDSLFPHN